MSRRNLTVFPHDPGNRHLHLLCRSPDAPAADPFAPADPAFRVLLAALLELAVDRPADHRQQFIAGDAFAAMLEPYHPCRNWDDLGPHLLAAQQYAVIGPDPAISPRLTPFHVRARPAPGAPLDATADVAVGSMLGLRPGPDVDPSVLHDLANLGDAYLRAWLAVHIRHAAPDGPDDVFTAAERRCCVFGVRAAPHDTHAADRVFQSLPGIRILDPEPGTRPGTLKQAWRITPIIAGDP